VAKPKLECLDCNPPRQFKSLPGYNGHMQFKHDKTGAIKERPASKQTEMIQQLLDQQEHLLNQQDKLVNQQQALYALIAERSDKPIAVNEPIGVFSGGNGNGNPGNNNQGNSNGNPGNNNQGNSNGNPGNNNGNGSGNIDQGEDVQEYHCQGCESPIFPGQEHCPSCKGHLNWNGVAVN